MLQSHRVAIRQNFISLVEQTDLDQMVSALYEKGVFSEPMIEPYKDVNKEVRSRKRQLYRDIERRGPDAFPLLLEALTETGKWNLVRALDPDSVLHPRKELGSHSGSSESQNFVSLSKKPTAELRQQKDSPEQEKLPQPIDDFSNTEMPQFHVIKSENFVTSTDDGYPLYPTRGRQRGLMVAFSCYKFNYNVDKHRKGVKVDCTNLKYLFNEIGFKTLFYNNISKLEFEQTLRSLRDVSNVSAVECVFIVVSSHGYWSPNRQDAEIRCSDGGLVPIQDIIEQFNNKNFPELQGVPKVFIFQTCRGDSEDNTYETSGAGGGAERDGTADGETEPRPHPPPRHFPKPAGGRLYSDILIAHSTLPGFVSRRDPKKGSWYVQALCQVFAERAHDCHVEQLFSLVDEALQQFGPQTSSIDRWGFNKRLYLHPGLFEENASST